MRTSTGLRTLMAYTFFSFCLTLAQAQVMLLPFVAKDNSEVVLAYDSKTGKSMEWYFDKTEQKMMHAAEGFQLPDNTGVQGPVQMHWYIDPEGSEVVLIWNPLTGESVSWYYDFAFQKMMKSEPKFQIPPIGLKGKIMMYPYLGTDRSEVVLCWETTTGKSVQFYFDVSLQKYVKIEPKFELPVSEELAGNVMMHPYIGSDGSEVILVWNVTTGKSLSWYLDREFGKYVKAKPGYQLPRDPIVRGNIMMFPYVGNDNSEVVLVWDTETGNSISYYYENSTEKFTIAAPEFQLPSDHGVGSKIRMHPFAQKKTGEVIYVWSTVTGKSVNYYYDEYLKKFVRSEDKWQLPANPLQ